MYSNCPAHHMTTFTDQTNEFYQFWKYKFLHAQIQANSKHTTIV